MKASAPRLTAKALDELTRRANEVKSRFSLSSYYQSQVKEPTAEMLKQSNAEIDPVTGDIVKKRRVKKEKVEKVEKVEKKEEEMVLESDSDSDDDVIRDNKAAIAARKEEEKVKAAPAPKKRATKKEKEESEEEKPAPKKRVAKEEKPKTIAKMEEPAMEEDSESEEDNYIPLAERLKMKMNNEEKSTIVDDLINTKSTVPASRKRKTAGAKSEGAAKKRKVKYDSSDDSLFGF